jgi:hypothetical protein
MEATLMNKYEKVDYIYSTLLIWTYLLVQFFYYKL